MTARPDEVVAFRTLVSRLQNVAYTHGGVDAEDLWSDKKYADAHDKSRAAFHAVIDAHEAALQSANARLAALLALAELWEKEVELMECDPDIFACLPHAYKTHAEAIRRAAAGEGDANQGDGE